jgi:hypothetical protein
MTNPTINDHRLPASATAMLLPWRTPAPEPSQLRRTAQRRIRLTGLLRPARRTHTTKEVSA